MTQPPDNRPDTPPAEPDRDRYAFNLPRGSVRGALVMMIMLPFWVLLAWLGLGLCWLVTVVVTLVLIVVNALLGMVVFWLVVRA